MAKRRRRSAPLPKQLLLSLSEAADEALEAIESYSTPYLSHEKHVEQSFGIVQKALDEFDKLVRKLPE